MRIAKEVGVGVELMRVEELGGVEVGTIRNFVNVLPASVISSRPARSYKSAGVFRLPPTPFHPSPPPLFQHIV